jgi:alpha-beta hydrolase superfamily lysophospholipase
MSASVARPGTTRNDVPELIRTWEPQAPRADLVLLHGLAEHSGRYEAVGAQLAGAGFRVRSFDLIGFGASGGTRGDIESWTRYLDQVEDHVRAIRSDLPLVLFGHSMGGLIALEYTIAERPAPDLLILSSPGLMGGRAWQRAVAPFGARLAPKLAMPNGLKGEQLSRDPAVGEAYFADPLVLTKSTNRLGAEMFAAMARTRAMIDRLDVPTLVIHGGADTVVPAYASAPLGELDNVTRKLYPKLRHDCMNEPEGREIVSEIIGWLDARLAELTKR